MLSLSLVLVLKHKNTFYIDDLGLLHLYEFGNFGIAARHIIVLIPGCILALSFFDLWCCTFLEAKPQEVAGFSDMFHELESPFQPFFAGNMFLFQADIGFQYWKKKSTIFCLPYLPRAELLATYFYLDTAKQFCSISPTLAHLCKSSFSFRCLLIFSFSLWIQLDISNVLLICCICVYERKELPQSILQSNLIRSPNFVFLKSS